MQAYSLDLRRRVVRAYEEGNDSVAEVAEQFSVSIGFVKKMLRQLYRGGRRRRRRDGRLAATLLARLFADRVDVVKDPDNFARGESTQP